MRKYKSKREAGTKRSVIVSAAAILLLLTGTLAWQSFSQLVTNETMGFEDGEPGGRLHDDFDGVNKDVYIENYADIDEGASVYARIRLSEYYEYGPGAGTGDDSMVTVLKGDKSIDANPVLNDPLTWDVHLFNSKAVDGTENIRTFRDLAFGGSTIYMPTFNKNIYSLKADINGTLEGPDGDKFDTADSYLDYKTYVDQETSMPTTEYYVDPSNSELEITIDNVIHTAQSTLGSQVISMATWEAQGTPVGEYWVYDTDGWAYWAAPIEPQTATGLLLDEVLTEGNPKGEWYYGVHVTAQIATAGDWGDEPSLENATGSGMYEGGISDEALALLELISGTQGVSESRAKAVSVTISAQGETAIDDGVATMSIGDDLQLSAEVEIENPTKNSKEEKAVTWSITEKNSENVDDSLLKASLTADGLFTPVDAMEGKTFVITATSDLTTDVPDEIEVVVLEGKITVSSEIDKLTLSNENSSIPLKVSVQGLISKDILWYVAELEGNSGLTVDELNATVTVDGVFKPLDVMAGGKYQVIAGSESNPNVSGSKDIEITAAKMTITSATKSIAIGDTLKINAVTTGLVDTNVYYGISRKNGDSSLTVAQIMDSLDSVTGEFTPVTGMDGCTFTITAINESNYSIYSTIDITVK